MSRFITAAVAVVLAAGACAPVPSSSPSLGVPVSRPQTLDLTIENDTTYPIYFIYVSPANSAYWSDDILGRSILYPGEAVTVWVPVGSSCLYDMRTQDDRGNSFVHTGIDVCDSEAVTIY